MLGYSNDVRVGGSEEDLVLAQPIDVFGRTSASRSVGDALVLQAEAGLRQTTLELQTDVIGLYVESAAASERLRSAEAVEATATRLLEAVRGLVDGGKLPGVQATRVSIELERARAARKQRRAELTASNRRLVAALGTDSQAVVTGFPAIPTTGTTDENLAVQRADLLVLSAETAAAEADVRMARTSRLPQLELQGRRSPWQDTDPAYGARLQLTIPLFDSGRSRADEGAAKKRAEASRKSFADAARIARAEIEAARIEVSGAQEQVTGLEAIVQTSRNLVLLTETGLKEGANTLIDVLDAVRAQRELEEDLTEARLTLAKTQATYLRATGTLIGVRP